MNRAGNDARGRGDVLGAGATDSFLFQLLCSGLGLSNGLLCGLFLGGFSRLRLGDLLGSFSTPGSVTLVGATSAFSSGARSLDRVAPPGRATGASLARSAICTVSLIHSVTVANTSGLSE